MNKELSRYILGIKPGDLAKKVILTPFLPLKYFKKEFQEIERSFAGKIQYKGFTGIKNEEKVSIINTGLGASSIGDLVVWLKGHVEYVLLVGSAGALNNKLQIGDYFLPIEAVDGEGFSQYYLQNPKEKFRNASKVNIHKDLAEKCEKLPIQKGKVYSIGSLNAEDPILLELLKTHGIDTIDMETSALYSAAKASDIKALALLYISDQPQSKPFYKKLSNEDQLRLNYALEGFAKTTVDLILSL